MDLRQIRLVPARGETLPTEAARLVRAASRIVVNTMMPLITTRIF
jgi:hypothetical protein